MSTDVLMRPYQQRCIGEMCTALHYHRSALLHMATGTGKTFCFSRIVKSLPPVRRWLIVANRDTLIHQLSREVAKWTGEEVDIEKASLKADDGGLLDKKRIVVASIQTLISGAGPEWPGRMAKFKPEEFSGLLCDEAHGSMSNSYLKLFHYFQKGNPGIYILGATATPERGDKKSLGLVYAKIGASYPLRTAIQDGWLVPFKQAFVPLDGVKLDGIKTRLGDLAEDQLAAVMGADEPVRQASAWILSHYADRKTVVFTAGIDHGEALAATMNALKPGVAQNISSRNNDSERAAIMNRFYDGRSPILCNHNIVSEGWDHPPVSYIANVRPTKSRGRYAQAVGRAGPPLCDGLIDLPDSDSRRRAIAASVKPYAEVHDFTGDCRKHVLAWMVDLLADTAAMNDRVREKCEAILRDGLSRDVSEVIEKAQREVADEEAEKARKEEAEKFQSFRTHRFKDALQFQVTGNMIAVDPFEPFSLSGVKRPEPPPWTPVQPLTPPMIDVLRKMRMTDEQISQTTRWHFNKIMERVNFRRKRNLCTLPQAGFLARRGYDPAHMTFNEAHALISQLIESGRRGGKP